MKVFYIVFTTLIIVAFSFVNVRSQNWQKIVPLKSKCEDIKLIFNVEECKFPVSYYNFSKITLVVEYTTQKNRWKAPSKKVADVIIIFKELIPLKEIGVDLSAFRIEPVSDLPRARIYINDTKGIKIEAQRIINDELYVTSIRLTASRSRKLK